MAEDESSQGKRHDGGVEGRVVGRGIGDGTLPQFGMVRSDPYTNCYGSGVAGSVLRAPPGLTLGSATVKNRF